MEVTKANLGFGNITCDWGMHIAGLYENEDEKNFIITNFLKQGFKEDNLQIFSYSEQTKEEFVEKMSNCCCNKDDILNPDTMKIIPAKELYYKNGEFSPFNMIDSLRTLYEELQSNGPRYIRAAAEMTWAKKKIIGIEGFMLYESMLNNFIANKNWISICMYNINEFSGKMIIEALRTHPYSICGGVLVENPYYINPEKWLMDNAHELYKLEMISLNGNRT